jgi:hypothetical protein
MIRRTLPGGSNATLSVRAYRFRSNIFLVTPFNPYAPPQATGPSFPGQMSSSAFRVEGDRLIILKDAVLPPICVWNGEPAPEGYVQRNLTWVPQWTAVFALSPLIYIIIFMVVKKTGGLRYALSEAARKRRRSGIIIAVGGVLASVVLMIAGGASNAPVLLVVGIFAMLITLIVGAVRARVLTIVKIDKTHIHLKLPPAAQRAFEHAA